MKILSWGKDIILTLKALGKYRSNEETQERNRASGYTGYFRDLTREFCDGRDGEAGLLEGAIIIAKYHYPGSECSRHQAGNRKDQAQYLVELNTTSPRWSA